MTPEKLLTADEVSDVLGVSRSKVYKMMSLKEIPTVTIGKNVRVSVEDLNEYISKHKTYEGDKNGLQN